MLHTMDLCRGDNHLCESRQIAEDGGRPGLGRRFSKAPEVAVKFKFSQKHWWSMNVKSGSSSLWSCGTHDHRHRAIINLRLKCCPPDVIYFLKKKIITTIVD